MTENEAVGVEKRPHELIGASIDLDGVEGSEFTRVVDVTGQYALIAAYFLVPLADIQRNPDAEEGACPSTDTDGMP